jgi:DNA-binding transcriptional ArsR family regulator
MSSIFPIRDSVSLGDREPRLVDLDEETADEVFEALSSGTTRTIFLELHNSPQTASDLADVTETSVQNAQYHLQKLQEADLVDVVDTWYSERGSEMKVYAPSDESLVLFAGRDKQHSLRRLVNRVMGILGVLVPSSALVGLGTRWYQSTTDGTDGGDGATGDEAGTINDTAETQSEPTAGDDLDRTATDDADGGDSATTEDGADGADEFDAPDMEGTNDTDVGEYANETADLNESLQPATDGGTDQVMQNSTEAVDAAAGIDPLLAAGLFFLGGLLVFGAFTLYYGDFY